MASTTRLSHRHQPSTLSFSSASSSSSSTRPALPQILSNSASNAVNFTRSTAPTSRRVRSHWFAHFVLNWRRSSRSSKFILGISMSFVVIQIIASIYVLFTSWEMYCDKPLRVFVTVYIVRLILTTPLSIYTHLTPNRRPTQNVDEISSSSSSSRLDLAEAYAMSERNRPVSFPPAVMPSTQHRQQQQDYPPYITLAHQRPTPILNTPEQLDENAVRAWVDRAKSSLDLFAVLWFIIGNYMLFSSSTCSDTAIPLYYFSLVLIIYGYLILSVPVLLCTSVIFCLPCVLVGMRLLHVDDGLYMGGASTEEIAMISVYQFKTTTTTTPKHNNNNNLTIPSNMDHITIDLSKPNNPPKSGIFDKLWLYLGLIDPPCETEPEYDILEIPDTQDQVCVICLSTYEDGDMLSRLWCKHHFHRACIKEWLILNRRCPLCKQDFGGKDILFDV